MIRYKLLTLIVLLTLLVTITGCANQDAINALIAQSNVDNRKAFATAMVAAAATPSAADDVAIAMYFSGNTGQQHFVANDTALDYMKAFLPYANMLLPLAYSAQDDSSSKSGISAGRDVYIDSTRSGDVGTDILGTSSSIYFNPESDPYSVSSTDSDFACEGCSIESMLEGKCSC